MPGEKLNEILVSEEELERSEDRGDYYKLHPWWGHERPFALKAEYSSYDQVTDLNTIRGLIGRADREFEVMEMPGGEFANF